MLSYPQQAGIIRSLVGGLASADEQEVEAEELAEQQHLRTTAVPLWGYRAAVGVPCRCGIRVQLRTVKVRMIAVRVQLRAVMVRMIAIRVQLRTVMVRMIAVRVQLRTVMVRMIAIRVQLRTVMVRIIAIRVRIIGLGAS